MEGQSKNMVTRVSSEADFDKEEKYAFRSKYPQKVLFIESLYLPPDMEPAR
jgi:hypothetical protein